MLNPERVVFSRLVEFFGTSFHELKPAQQALIFDLQSLTGGLVAKNAALQRDMAACQRHASDLVRANAALQTKYEDAVHDLDDAQEQLKMLQCEPRMDPSVVDCVGTQVACSLNLRDVMKRLARIGEWEVVGLTPFGEVEIAIPDHRDGVEVAAYATAGEVKLAMAEQLKIVTESVDDCYAALNRVPSSVPRADALWVYARLRELEETADMATTCIQRVVDSLDAMAIEGRREPDDEDVAGDLPLDLWDESKDWEIDSGDGDEDTDMDVDLQAIYATREMPFAHDHADVQGSIDRFVGRLALGVVACDEPSSSACLDGPSQYDCKMEVDEVSGSGGSTSSRTSDSGSSGGEADDTYVKLVHELDCLQETFEWHVANHQGRTTAHDQSHPLGYDDEVTAVLEKCYEAMGLAAEGHSYEQFCTLISRCEELLIQVDENE